MNKPYQLEFSFMKARPRMKRPKRLGREAFCVYCGKLASTRDHVPSRCLLERPFPKNLITVPCCQRCNRNFSLDEEYFLVALAQVGFCPTLMSKVDAGGVVYRALEKSAALDDMIFRSLTAGENGTVIFHPELDRMTNVVQKIACGLFFHRYSRRPNLNSFYPIGIFHRSESVPQPLVAAMHYWPGIRRKKWQIVQANVFSYLFAKGWMGTDPPLICFVEFHNTLLAVVGCPDPRSLPKQIH